VIYFTFGERISVIKVEVCDFMISESLVKNRNDKFQILDIPKTGAHTYQIETTDVYEERDGKKRQQLLLSY
jgi:hypothetical protein